MIWLIYTWLVRRPRYITYRIAWRLLPIFPHSGRTFLWRTDITLKQHLDAHMCHIEYAVCWECNMCNREYGWCDEDCGGTQQGVCAKEWETLWMSSLNARTHESGLALLLCLLFGVNRPPLRLVWGHAHIRHTLRTFRDKDRVFGLDDVHKLLCVCVCICV